MCNLSIDSTRNIVYNEITIKQEQSQGRRKYRKGNQEYKVRTGNRIKAAERKRAGKLVKVADGVAVGKVKEYMSQSSHICTGKLMIGCNKPLNITFDYFGSTLLIHEWWMIEPETRETVTDIVIKYFESIAA